MVRWLRKKIRAQISARVSRETLLSQAVHGDNITALAAIEELKERLLFQDGTLQGLSFAGARLHTVQVSNARLQLPYLTGAVLTSCYLGDTDLSKARLLKANLADGNLRECKLVDADLTGAVLRGAHLAKADLRGAVLRSTDLTGANLWQAHLHAANFTGAVLTQANLSGANFNPHTIMPDGRNWHSELDLSLYTGRPIIA